MPSFSALNKFFGSTASGAASYAAGGAVRRSLDPLLQDVVNEAWELHPHIPPDAYYLAQGVAQGQVNAASAAAWAKQNGIGPTAWTAIVNIANSGPELARAYEAWRRKFLTDADFEDALNRTGLEKRWWPAMKKLKTRLLDIADLARGIHKGLIRDPGLLATPAPSGTGKVPAYPVYDIDALAAAEGQGWTKEELGVLVGLQGNPMGAHEAAQAQFRGILEPVDYDRAIAEGNTRNEWGDAIREQSRQIPTARDYLENALRGYRSLAEAVAGAAKHGMSREDATLIYQNQGRPMTVHQITMALARGAKFNPEPGEIKDPYRASIVEGSLKPGYYELEESLKYSYPGFFQTLNALAKGWIDPATATNWLLYQGYEPTAVRTIVGGVTGAKSGTTGTTTKPKTLTRAELRAAWKAGQFDDATVLQRLEAEGLSAADAQTLLNVWKSGANFEQPPPATT